MGYLNNSVVTVDAILTKKGRELLARGDGSFRITQFALADDEIDYTLYNTSHPSGSAYYGEVMKYKLTTLPRGTAKLPILEAGYASITLKQGASLTITPQTLNFLGTSQAYESSGYTVMIADVRLLSNFTGVGIQTSESERLNQTTTLGTNVSKTVIGTSINISGTTINTLYGASSNTLTSTITIIGRDSGARITIPIKITKVN